MELFMRKLRFMEVQREASNNRTMMANTILPLIQQLEKDEIMPNIQDVYNILVEMTQFSVTKSYLACPLCRYC